MSAEDTPTGTPDKRDFGAGGALPEGMDLSDSQGYRATATSAEATIMDTAPLREGLLSGLAAAYDSYAHLLNDANNRRGDTDQLPVTDIDTIRAKVEATLTPGVLADLRDSMAHLAGYTEVRNPRPGFDLLVIPEGITAADNEATAHRLQNGINTENLQQPPYIRPKASNDTRGLINTGNGYNVAFAPRHYNIPVHDIGSQNEWLQFYNHAAQATELQTASDEAALAVIDRLVTTGQLHEPHNHFASCFHQTFYRRFDHDDDAYVAVTYNGQLGLGENFFYSAAARALVVPKV